MLGQLTSKEADVVLHMEVFGRIGCCANDIPYIVPIYYAYEDGFVYAVSKEGKKVEIMRKNSNVCFEVEQFENTGNWKTVIIQGEFEEIVNKEERKRVLQILHARNMPLIASEMAQLSPFWPFEPTDMNSINGVVYKIAIKKKTGRYEVKLETR